MLKSADDRERIFDEQLERLGFGHFDYYLIHSLGISADKQAQAIGTFEFVQRKKREGKIRNVGISFHETPELLDEILSGHQGLDFLKLQINYIDWANPGIQSRRCLEIARKHALPIIVTEPSWAIRFAASQDGVMMVLSGMNTIEQVLDITSSMSEFKALNEEEYKVIEKVSEIINANTVVPCIACKSCEKACPQHLEISEYRKDVSATFDNGPGLRTK